MSLCNRSVKAAVELEKERFILFYTLFEVARGLRRLRLVRSSSPLMRSISRYRLFLLRVLEAMKVASILEKPVDAVFNADIYFYFNIIFIT